MSGNSADLQILITANNLAAKDLDNIKRSLGGLNSSLTDTEKASRKAESGFESLIGQGAKLGLGFVGVTGGIAALEKLGGSLVGTIGVASDLNETVSKSRVLFGESSKFVEAFGESAATAFGQSKQQAVAAAADFGNMFKSMGMGQKAAADMSVQMVQLAGDLSSFHNIDSATALEKLRAGLVGEAEPLRTLGVLLSEEAVKLKAVDMGLVSNANLLTEAQKVQARYALIMEQTAAAQGDFERTGDGLANSQRKVQASLANLSSEIGKELLPAAVTLTNALAKGLPDAIDETKKALDDIRPLTRLVGEGFGLLGEGIDKAGGAANLFKAAVFGMTPGLRETIWLLGEAADRLGMGKSAPAESGFLSGIVHAAKEAKTATAEVAGAADKAAESLTGMGRGLTPDQLEAQIRAPIREKEAIEAATEAKRRQEQAIKDAASEAERAADRIVSAERAARDGAQDVIYKMSELADETAANIAGIRSKVSEDIRKLAGDTTKAINRTIADAVRSLEQLNNQEILAASTEARKKKLTEDLSAAQKVHKRQVEDQEALYELNQDLARAKDEDDKKALRQRYEWQRQDVAHRRQLEDQEAQWEKLNIEKPKAEFERALHDEELNRQRARIITERDERIVALRQEQHEREIELNAQAGKDIARTEATAKAALKKLETEFFRKLPEAAGGAIAELAGLVGSALGKAVAVVDAAIARAGGGGGGGGSYASTPAGQAEDRSGASSAAAASVPRGAGAIHASDGQTLWSQSAQDQANFIAAAGGSTQRAAEMWRDEHNRDVRGFATGGRFKVGGVGGVDSQLVMFRASPQEEVTINPPGQSSPVIDYDRLAAALARHPIIVQMDKREVARLIRQQLLQDRVGLTSLGLS